MHSGKVIPFIDFGAHSHTHPSLDKLNIELQLFEIKKSKEILEKHLGHSISTFAYPSGHYNNATLKILSTLKFSYAYAVKPKNSNKKMNNYEIPRFGIYQKSKIGFISLILKNLTKKILNV